MSRAAQFEDFDLDSTCRFTGQNFKTQSNKDRMPFLLAASTEIGQHAPILDTSMYVSGPVLAILFSDVDSF